MILRRTDSWIHVIDTRIKCFRARARTLGEKACLHDQIMKRFSEAHEWRPNDSERNLNSSGRAQNNLEEVIGIPKDTYKH